MSKPDFGRCQEHTKLPLNYKEILFVFVDFGLGLEGLHDFMLVGILIPTEREWVVSMPHAMFLSLSDIHLVDRLVLHL